MKISINKNVLETVLLNTQPYLEKKDLSQITSHLFISSNDDSFVVKATDYEIGFLVSTNNLTINQEGSITANGNW